MGARSIVVPLVLALFLGAQPRPVTGFTSLCRSTYPDPTSLDAAVQCDDRTNGWPQEYQYCLPDNWGMQCGTCLETCYFMEVEGDKTYLPFRYTLPTVELFAATCDRKTVGKAYVNESSLGIYCCKPCDLWRLVSERCGVLHEESPSPSQSDQRCFLENPQAQQGMPTLRAQSSLDNSEDLPHWILVPAAPNRGIEDGRTDFSVFRQAWRIAMNPSAYLAPINSPTSSEGNSTARTVQFNENILPGRMGRSNVAIGMNQGNRRSQHQAHIHYTGFPLSFRSHLLTEAQIPQASDPATAECTVASGLRIGTLNVVYFGWYFPWDLASASLLPHQQWNLRSLALKQCPPLVNTLVRGTDGELLRTPGPLPCSNGSALPLNDPEDFLMLQTSIVIAPSFALDAASGRPLGHYVLLGSDATNFHAEGVLCDKHAVDGGGWDAAVECPPTAEGWPAAITPDTAAPGRTPEGKATEVEVQAGAEAWAGAGAGAGATEGVLRRRRERRT